LLSSNFFWHNHLSISKIDFFNFRHCKVWNFKILNQSKQNQNFVGQNQKFAVNFQKHWKQKWKSTKYIATE